MFESFKNLFNSKPKKYKVITCVAMPSLVGMTTIDKPKVNQKTIFIGKNGQFRTLTPIKLIEDKTLTLYTEHLEAILEQIK